jgi:hypothetical protein
MLARIEIALRSDEPVYARGVAMVRLLLSDGESSLYFPARRRDLIRQLERTDTALEGREETW